MRRLIALTCTGLLALAAPLPALAQGGQVAGYGAGGQGNQSYGAGQQGTQSNGGPGEQAANGTPGTEAYDQAPPTGPFGNVSPFLIIGGIAGGAGLIAYAVSQNQNNNNSSSSPASP